MARAPLSELSPSEISEIRELDKEVTEVLVLSINVQSEVAA